MVSIRDIRNGLTSRLADITDASDAAATNDEAAAEETFNTDDGTRSSQSSAVSGARMTLPGADLAEESQESSRSWLNPSRIPAIGADRAASAERATFRKQDEQDQGAEATVGGSRRNEISQKELQKLRRVDLLELLLDATRENEEQAETIAELNDLSERLKAKLDDKDAQIERLKTKLDQKDAQIKRLHDQNASFAHGVGTLDVHEMMEVQRIAVERYLQHVKERNAEVARAAQSPSVQSQPADTGSSTAFGASAGQDSSSGEHKGFLGGKFGR